MYKNRQAAEDKVVVVMPRCQTKLYPSCSRLMRLQAWSPSPNDSSQLAGGIATSTRVLRKWRLRRVPVLELSGMGRGVYAAGRPANET